MKATHYKLLVSRVPKIGNGGQVTPWNVYVRKSSKCAGLQAPLTSEEEKLN